jgi:hypothetical protein
MTRVRGSGRGQILLRMLENLATSSLERMDLKEREGRSWVESTGVQASEANLRPVFHPGVVLPAVSQRVML